jgi:site-specific recombinase XerC
LILKFFYDSGLRVSALSRVKKKHFDWANCKGMAYKCKGNKQRPFYYSPELSRELQIFIRNMTQKQQKCDYLF